MEPSKEAIKLSAFVPMQFIANVDIGETAGDEGRGQVAINDRPFILQAITHQKIPTALDLNHDVTGWAYQDGLYTLDWSLYEQARFWKGVPPMADAGFGSIRDGNWIQLPAPVSLPGNETLHVRIVNQVDRQAEFTVQVIWHGIQRGGQMSQVGV
jgi:hypothetical protein